MPTLLQFFYEMRDDLLQLRSVDGEQFLEFPDLVQDVLWQFGRGSYNNTGISFARGLMSSGMSYPCGTAHAGLLTRIPPWRQCQKLRNKIVPTQKESEKKKNCCVECQLLERHAGE